MKNKTLIFLLLLVRFSFSQVNNFPFYDTSLTLNERLDDLINRLTIEEKTNLLWEGAPAIERLGIPKYFHGNEALHGPIRPGKFTVFPQAIALAATWNRNLIGEIATAISDEARGRWNELEHGKLQKKKYSDLLTFWSPTVNMARDPRWGRTAETYGEDPYLTSQLGIQFVKGLQGNHERYLKVVSTPKHYVANNVETNRFGANAVISERTLREYYLKGFQACIMEGKAESIMSSYTAINWVPSSANRWLLKDVLREDWGFDGYVVSDCGAPGFLVRAHHFTENKASAAAGVLRAGLDLECTGGQFILRDNLVDAYQQGKITMSEIDNAVRNVLKARFRLGLFDPIEANPYNHISPGVVGCEAHQNLSLKAAIQATVLLKNHNGILPLNERKLKSIAVIGHNASRCEFGDYSGVPINEPISPIMGIKEYVGTKAKINFVDTDLKMHNLGIIDSKFLYTDEGKTGLRGEYFEGTKFNGQSKIRIDPTIDFHSKDNPPDAFFKYGEKSIRWEGHLKAPSSGLYKIGVSSDDGIRLWIEEELVLDFWQGRNETMNVFEKEMVAGKKYKIKLEYFDAGNDASCQLYWREPGEKYKDFLYAEEKLAAEKSDVVIAVLGTGRYSEHEGIDKENLDLPGNQLEMLKEVAKVNPNIVVVLVAGSQHNTGWMKENIPGIVNCWYPGDQGGRAIAEVLFGKANPAGRLPLTYYEDVEKIPAMDRYEISEGRTYMYYDGEPLWEFGYGLSYTQFAYSNLQISEKNVSSDEDFTLSLNIKNTGKFDGDEVVQVYASYPEKKIIRPIKHLIGFERINIKKGKIETLKIKLNRKDFSYWDETNNEWAVESGSVEILVGNSSNSIQLSGMVNMQ